MQYTQEDYYRIIHRREVQGKASRKAALGGRTTLQLDSDLEEEFLKSRCVGLCRFAPGTLGWLVSSMR